MDERVERLLKLAIEISRNPPEEGITGSVPRELEPLVKWLNSLAHRKRKVAYLGPPGSYTHEASTYLFPEERNTLVPKRTISEVFDSVAKGESDFGVVPIANKLEGPVNETIDNLLFHEVHVVKSIEIPIRIVLGSGTVNRIEEIKKVYGHPMIFGQATKLLSRLRVPTIATTSTSEAAKIASEEDGAAALCSPMAARLYNLKVLLDSVEDYPSNSTRFFVIGKELLKDGSYTALLTSVPHKPGGLYHFLEPFASKNVNLTMIYSRPMKGYPWNFVFYIEMEGSIEELREVLEEAKRRSMFLKVLGSYNMLEVRR
ncbi:chorismate mutase [Ignicoccus pacificus DSM 13166]|uniref:prephenate dehydratase n=1 Tax=Ignicoccus pacificus DSM 13166 TaxID=940294 RepID=A0A977PKE7_9CREN|nr:chorismate mutase [Ignicoccus pacificus DSM 13166]